MSLYFGVSALRKEYEGSQVLDGVSFEFDQKGVYVLMGGNGAGKSTFLRICALLENTDSGEVAYSDNDKTLAHDIGLKRRLTLLLPGTGVFNSTVYDNAAYGLKIRGIKGEEARTKVLSVLELAGLSRKLKQNALTLSSGETRRLGLARALVLNPEVLFLDEPSAFVDAQNRAIIEDIILGLKKDQKTVVVMTTHDKNQAARLADTLLTLENGKIEAD